jgi:acetyl esterase
MPVDPLILALLERITPPGSPRIPELPLDGCRRLMDLYLPLAGPKADVESIRDRSLSGIPIRIYRPEGAEVQPACVYFHGGGWALGRLDHYDSLCSQIANQSRWTLISVDYRLAPEHKFPIPVLDCWTTLQAVLANSAHMRVDPSRIVVAGDSAGGNLAAVVSMLARDYGLPLAGQVLIYPVTDFISNRESYKFDYLLGREDMIAFWNYYLHSPTESESSLASPLRARSFAGLPKTLILTAEFDPLRDEGEEYGQKLRESGVDALTCRYEGMIHGFVNMGAAIPQSRQAILQIAKQLMAWQVQEGSPQPPSTAEALQ